MSIPRRSGSSKSPCQRLPRTELAPGFTLIELLVVIAIIALLISILLPSLRSARETARAAACGQRLRDLGNGMQIYISEEKDWIPGSNTSGAAAWANKGTPGSHNPRVPVQNYDWMTPSMCRSTQLKDIRAKRFKELTNVFACPSQVNCTTTLYAASAPQDKQDFMAESGWVAISFLMPISYQLWGSDYRNTIIATHATNPNLKLYANCINGFGPSTTRDWEVTYKTYQSQLRQVGTPSDKIAAADGTRYVTDFDQSDFDYTVDPINFGSFASAGAWWAGSAEYGVRASSQNWNNRSVTASPPNPSNGANLTYTYRHGTSRGAGMSGTAQANAGMINALFFDASVRRLDDKRSRSPRLWYPKGAVITKAQEGMLDDLQNGAVVP